MLKGFSKILFKGIRNTMFLFAVFSLGVAISLKQNATETGSTYQITGVNILPVTEDVQIIEPSTL